MSLLKIGLILKGFDALFEIAGGVLLFFPNSLNRWIIILCQHDLVREHAKPQTVGAIEHHAAQAIYGASLAGALYLLAHGITKIIFIGGVLWRRRWGYLGLVFILVVFTAFELFRSVSGGGVALFLFGAFDAYLAYLVWQEYRRERPAIEKA